MTNLVVRRNRALNPWMEMNKLFQDFDRSFEAEPRKPVVHIDNQESGVVLTAELPGFAAEDLDIQVKENLLTIKAMERGKKKKDPEKTVFERSFVLAEDLNADSINAEMKNGLLTLDIRRKEKPAPLAVKVKG